jgi:4-hydroxy-2-oxoglutarate aldolase
MLVSGIYPPVPTFFDTQDELDLATLRQHILRLAESSCVGFVLLGSNGEAVHLSESERAQVFATARGAVLGLSGTSQKFSLIAGCGAQSTRATLAYCRQAAQHGMDYALILPPSYYRGRMDTRALLTHYRAVADASPLPVVLYNMPASAAGIDLDVETIIALSEHPNIIGVKDSSGNISKIAHVVALARPTFRVFAGSADFLLPALVAGAVGAVAALANVFPRAVCRVQALYEQEKLEEARILQAQLIPANAAVTTRYGVAGLKAALEQNVGYGGVPRLPLLPLSEQERKQVLKMIGSLPAEE